MISERINVGYVRVSTEEQQKHGFSIIDQKNEISMFAMQRGVEISCFYEDEGYSATSLKRPNIQNLIRRIASNEINEIYVRHSDRLIRNLLLRRSLENVFNTYNVKVISINDDWDYTTPEKGLQSDFSGLLDEFELKKIRPRIIRGLRGSASIGNYPIGSTPPIGYIRVKNEAEGKGSKLEINIDEAKVVREIFETIAANQISPLFFSKELNKHKILGKNWNENKVLRMITNPIYYGAFHQEWYHQEDHHKGIVTKELWDAANAAIKKRKKTGKYLHIFKGLIWCKNCSEYCILDSTARVEKQKKRTVKKVWLYYKCPCCNRKLSELKLIKDFAPAITDFQASSIDKQYLEEFRIQLNQKKRRIAMLNKDFDNNLLEDGYYEEQLHTLYDEIKEINKSIESFYRPEEKKFSDMSKEKKRAYVLHNVKVIKVDFKENTKKIIFKEEKQ